VIRQILSVYFFADRSLLIEGCSGFVDLIQGVIAVTKEPIIRLQFYQAWNGAVMRLVFLTDETSLGAK